MEAVGISVNPTPDLSVPRDVIAECVTMAEGMEQQALSAKNGTYGPHPQPAFYFSKAAAVYRAAVALLEKQYPNPEAGTQAKADAQKDKPKNPIQELKK